MSLKQWFTKVLCKQPSISLCFIAATLAERSRRSSGAVRDLREAANDEIWRVAA